MPITTEPRISQAIDAIVTVFSTPRPATLQIVANAMITSDSRASTPLPGSSMPSRAAKKAAAPYATAVIAITTHHM